MRCLGNCLVEGESAVGRGRHFSHSLPGFEGITVSTTMNVAQRIGRICWAKAVVFAALAPVPTSAQTRYATSDNQSGFVHWIDLYDANNSRIDPAEENPRPYSPEKTCGRCHEYETIAHGWHFNAVFGNVDKGRPGFPWIWRDPRTGTYLPLSYRRWRGSWSPDKIGISRWEMAAKIGPYTPGGGVGSLESLTAWAERVAGGSSAADGTEELLSESAADVDAEDREGAVEQDGDQGTAPPSNAYVGVDRSHLTGALPVDCMICHRNSGSGYSPFVWSEQVEEQNFAYAPTAALGLAVVTGNVSRLKDDFDPREEGAADRLPKVRYDLGRFRADGKVFFDLVRKPTNDACYYCHTNMAADAVNARRWVHDEDVHLRAGMQCADCHRNGLDHHIIRGFPGEKHPAGNLAAAFSCQGCHLGTAGSEPRSGPDTGRLGAPRPAHRGLPPVHFDRMTCTACHSGPRIDAALERQVNSMAHELGKHVKRTGAELPGILAGIPLPVTYQGVRRLTPHRLVWPSYWGVLEKNRVRPLHPERAYELVRRPLRVRKDFAEELSEVRLSLTQRRALLGEDRARVKEEEWTKEERRKIAAEEAKIRQQQVRERMAQALAAIEEAYPGARAVFVSGGTAFVRKGDDAIQELDQQILGDAAAPYRWPLAHNVRPARQSLGSGGCTECHSETSPLFQASFRAIPVLPGQETEELVVHQWQRLDRKMLSRWNQLFQGRDIFKLLGWLALVAAATVTFGAVGWNLGAWWRRKSV